MPARTARHKSVAAPPAHTRAGRARWRSVVVGAVVISATAYVAGPANAHEGTSTSAGGVQEQTSAVLPSPTSDAVGSFQAMLDRARHEALVHRRIVHRQAEAAAAHKRARAHAAKVRASRAALRSTIVRPVSGGYHLTARFGDSSSRWGSGRHTGLDFACAVGTPVHAVADGVVTSAGYSGAYGNRIEIRHADGTVTTYNHLSRITVHGGRVEAGQVIGLVGSTGNTTGPHLHFEVMQRGSYVDPEHWLAARYVSF